MRWSGKGTLQNRSRLIRGVCRHPDGLRDAIAHLNWTVKLIRMIMGRRQQFCIHYVLFSIFSY
jgi:hypothetical protein